MLIWLQHRSLWLFSSLFKPHFRAKQNLIERKGEAISIGITPLEKRGGILLETEKCVCLCNPPPSTHTHTVTTDYKHTPQMASASRLFTATTIENNGQRWPLLLLFYSLSLLSARVSVKWKRVCLGQWQADKEPAYPPPGCWIGGHVVLVIEGTIALRKRDRERVWHPCTDGKVQPGWPPEFRFELEVNQANQGKLARSQNADHMVDIL